MSSREPRKPLRPWQRRLAIAAAVIVVLLVLVRAAANPLATYLTRRALTHEGAYSGTVAHVEVGLLGLTVTAHKLQINQVPPKSAEPFLTVELVHSKAEWKGLLRGVLKGGSRIEHAKAVFVATGESSGGKSTSLVTVNEQLQRLTPIHITHTEVLDSEILVIDKTVKPEPGEPPPRLWMHDIALVTDNVANRDYLVRGKPSTVDVHASVQHSGRLDVHVSADAAAAKLNFDGDIRVRHLKLADMYGFVAAYTGLSIPRGTLDMRADFRAKDDHLSGRVLPRLSDVDIQAADSKVVNIAKEKVASAAYDVLASDTKDDRNELAAAAHIHGTVNTNKGDVYDAVIDVLRRSATTGLMHGLKLVHTHEARE
jgi:hypothetical protein